MSRAEGEVHWSRRKIRGSLKRKKDVTFQLHTIDPWETLSERKRTWKVITSRFFSIKLERPAENCIFFELSERRMHFAPECSETELHITQSVLTPIWWLPLFQVSGEKGSSDTEFHLQESPRYNIPLSGTTRLDSLSSSVANGELRWSRCPGLRIEMNDWPRTTETES